jgi:hypothetical protein
MKRHLLALAATLACAGAFAQNAAVVTEQRDANQQARIEQGLQSGQLTTREAGKLEKEEARVDRMQANALKDGNLSAAEKARLTAAQNDASRDIAAAKHNDITGNPNSASSKRMQADVARNAAQEQRIANGLKDGSLTNHEAAQLDRGQAHVSRKEAAAARNGHVGHREQASIQRSENHQSRKIHRERHDGQVKG